MQISLTELRSNIYKYFEQTKNSGIPLQIKTKQGTFTVSFSEKPKKLEILQIGGLDLFYDNPDDIINVVWPNPSQEETNLL